MFEVAAMKLKRHMGGAIITREPMPLVGLSRSVHAPRARSGKILAFAAPSSETKHQQLTSSLWPAATKFLEMVLVAAFFTALMAGFVALKFFFWAPFFLR